MTTRIKVALKVKRMTVSQLLTFASTVVSDINTASTIFTTPHPALADLSSAIADLQTANIAAHQGGVLETTTRNVAKIALLNLLIEIGHYVEDVANDPANQTPIDLPAQIIESAGMTVKHVAPRQKQIFVVKAGALAGTVIVLAEHVARGFHEWQTTTTPADASSWTDLTSTTKAKIILSDLTSGSRVYFRTRSVLKSGPQDWTSPDSVIVP